MPKKSTELKGQQHRVLGVYFEFHQMQESEQLSLLKVIEINSRRLRVHPGSSCQKLILSY